MARIIQLRLKREQIESRVRELAGKGCVAFGEHSLERLAERGISDVQAIRVFVRGEMRGDPVPGRRAGEWKVKFVDAVRGNREVGVVSVLIRNERLYVTTVEWEDL